MISDFSNEPIEMNIGERTFKFRQLSLLELYDDFAKIITSDCIKNITAVAKTIENKEERSEFLIQSMQSLPSGLGMELKVAEMEITMIGRIKQLYSAMKKDNDITIEELNHLVSSEEDLREDIDNIMTYIRNEHKIEKDPEEDPNKTKIDTEKKT